MSASGDVTNDEEDTFNKTLEVSNSTQQYLLEADSSPTIDNSTNTLCAMSLETNINDLEDSDMASESISLGTISVDMFVKSSNSTKASKNDGGDVSTGNKNVTQGPTTSDIAKIINIKTIDDGLEIACDSVVTPSSQAESSNVPKEGNTLHDSDDNTTETPKIASPDKVTLSESIIKPVQCSTKENSSELCLELPEVNTKRPENDDYKENVLHESNDNILATRNVTSLVENLSDVPKASAQKNSSNKGLNFKEGEAEPVSNEINDKEENILHESDSKAEPVFNEVKDEEENILHESDSKAEPVFNEVKDKEENILHESDSKVEPVSNEIKDQEENILHESDNDMVKTTIMESAGRAMSETEIEVHNASVIDNCTEDDFEPIESGIETVKLKVNYVSEDIPTIDLSSANQVAPVTDVNMDSLEEEFIKNNQGPIINTTVEMNKIDKSIKAVLETGKSITVFNAGIEKKSQNNKDQIDIVDNMSIIPSKNKNEKNLDISTSKSETVIENISKEENTSTTITKEIVNQEDNNTKPASSTVNSGTTQTSKSEVINESISIAENVTSDNQIINEENINAKDDSLMDIDNSTNVNSETTQTSKSEVINEGTSMPENVTSDKQIINQEDSNPKDDSLMDIDNSTNVNSETTQTSKSEVINAGTSIPENVTSDKQIINQEDSNAKDDSLTDIDNSTNVNSETTQTNKSEAINESTSISENVTSNNQIINQEDSNAKDNSLMDIDNCTNVISVDNSPIHIKTSHNLNKPDMMLEIPMQDLIDIDDVLDSPNDCQITDEFSSNKIDMDTVQINAVNENITDTVKTGSNENMANDDKNSVKSIAQKAEAVTAIASVNEESQPSTSYKLTPCADDMPEVSDSLGLLAESQRVIDDDDDDDAADDDDDFDNDESSSQMPTAEHSEDSNPQNSETDLAKDEQQREEAEEKISNESEGDVDEEQDRKSDFDALEIEEHELNSDSADVINAEKEKPKVAGDAVKDQQLLSNVESTERDTNDVPDDNVPKTLIKKNDKVPDSVKLEKKETKKVDEVVADEAPISSKSSDTMSDDVIVQPVFIPTYNLDSDSEDEAPSGTNQDKKKTNAAPTIATCSEKPAEEVPMVEPTIKGILTITNTPTGKEVPSTSGAVGNMAVIEVPQQTVISEVEKETAQNTVAQTVVKTEAGSAAVYNLDSDEEQSNEPNKSKKKAKKCINNTCISGATEFIMADSDTAAYYDASRKRRTLVCQPCADAVLARKRSLIVGIKDMIPLSQLDMSSTCQYSVEILDSESEDDEPQPQPQEEQKKEMLGEAAAKFLEENLVDILNDTWEKYKLDDRLKDTQDELYSEMETLEIKRKEIDEMLNECQRMTDKLRTELYATFEPRIQEQPPLIIYDKPEFCYIGPEAYCPELPSAPKTRPNAKRKMNANNTVPAKRPAVIPLGYTPLNDPRLKLQEGKLPANNSDDDKDVSVVKLSAESPPPDLPPPGELTRPPLKVGMAVYAVKNAHGPWQRGRILEVMPKAANQSVNSSFTVCRVQFINPTKNYNKLLPGRCIAYSDPPEVRMTIGTRLIALFQGSKVPSYSSGVVAEAPTPVNNFRYLVFFDDGYAQYVKHCHTRLVCECSPLVWDEVQPYSRDFVKEYLMAFPERPMVRLHKGQQFKTEWNGNWMESRVADVDASLVEVEFIADKRREWIYRGSTRLAPLYMELRAAERHRPRLLLAGRGRQLLQKDMPYVEYTRSEEQDTKLLGNLPKDTSMTVQQRNEDLRRQRAVAKKSTTMPALPSNVPLTKASEQTDSVSSRVVYYTPKNAVKPHKLVPHRCSPRCKRTDVLTLKELRTYNPLAKPLLSGWERQIVRFKGQKEVMYRAPCGRRLRNMKELHRYLQATDSELPVDLFDFFYGTHCLAEFQIYKCLTGKKDLSHGKENVPVPCVNYYDESLPEFCSYNTERTPTSGVPLNLDPEFLCGCDCTDDCEDKSKCACWQMTLEGAHTIGLEGPNIGYEYKRLPEPLPSGIYECNSRCKCKQTCLNRVAQHPLQLKLQVFKTLNRGWGIRALNDVPKGAFLCVYAGNLLTDATANLDGLNEGDEYLAELDYIEVVEQMKEGYEDDIPEADKKLDKKASDKTNKKYSAEESSSSSEEEESTSKYDQEDDDFSPGNVANDFDPQFRKHLRKRSRDEEKLTEGKDKGKSEDDCITISDDEEVREPSRFAALAGMGGNEFISKYKSVRALFGEDEACYIMDAKVQGNIGRYLNHSCSPNVFVQNVFVDTHDPRFPWVAFFALSHIKAGTELTWNYNYDVGSVPGKVLYCFCAAQNCRGRLL